MSVRVTNEETWATRAKTLALYLIMFGLILLFVEALAFASDYLTNDLYDHRDVVLDGIEPEDFAAAKLRVDPILGWVPESPSVVREANCLGVEIEYSVDKSGARIYQGYDGATARVVVVGDSFAQGYEVSDADAYPAQLAEQLGVSVANLGVAAYGPVQSLLRLERQLALYPEARVVILSIMYENTYRMVNSYRPVLYDDSEPFSFKPYMANGRIAPHPGEKGFESFERFTAYAHGAFDDDFWAKPRHEFPFSLSLARALNSNFFYFRKFQKRFRKLGLPEYFLIFRSEAIGSELFSLLDRYANFARARGVTPVVLFIPRNRLDTQSASGLIASNARRFDPDLIVGDVGTADLDWNRFSIEDLENDNICHPSSYGQRKIAEFIADLLASNGVRPG